MRKLVLKSSILLGTILISVLASRTLSQDTSVQKEEEAQIFHRVNENTELQWMMNTILYQHWNQ